MPFLMVPITSSNSIYKWVILGKKVDFSQFYQIFSYFFWIGLSLGFLFTHRYDHVWFRILQ